MSEEQLRTEICEIGKLLWERHLIGGAEGNISCRLRGDRILSTPTGAIKGILSPKDIVTISSTGEPFDESRASSEIGLHLSIYSVRPDVNAVVHAHPPVATAFAIAGKSLPERDVPEAEIVLGKVPIVPFAEPGTPQVGEAAAPFAKENNVLLLERHGAVAMGSTLREAYIRMETLERIAKAFLYASVIEGL